MYKLISYKDYSILREDLGDKYTDDDEITSTYTRTELPKLWNKTEKNLIVRMLKFNSFTEATGFLTDMINIIQDLNIEPEIRINRNKLMISLGNENEVTSKHIEFADRINNEYKIYGIDLAEQPLSPGEEKMIKSQDNLNKFGKISGSVKK